MVDYRRLYLIALNFMLAKNIAECPPPTTQIKYLEKAAKSKLMAIDDITNPALPDEYLDMFGLFLKKLGFKADERKAMLQVALATEGTSSANATSFSEAVKDAEKEGLLDNLGDIGKEIFDLDLAGAVSEVVDTISDLLSWPPKII